MYVWYCILAIVPITGLAIFVISFLSPYYLFPAESKAEYGTLGRAVWFTFGAFVAQGVILTVLFHLFTAFDTS